MKSQSSLRMLFLAVTAFLMSIVQMRHSWEIERLQRQLELSHQLTIDLYEAQQRQIKSLGIAAPAR